MLKIIQMYNLQMDYILNTWDKCWHLVTANDLLTFSFQASVVEFDHFWHVLDHDNLSSSCRKWHLYGYYSSIDIFIWLEIMWYNPGSTLFIFYTSLIARIWQYMDPLNVYYTPRWRSTLLAALARSNSLSLVWS